MKRIINNWIFRIVRHLHKKSENKLIALKKQKQHGTQKYKKVAGTERKLRDLKKAIQAKCKETPTTQSKP